MKYIIYGIVFTIIPFTAAAIDNDSTITNYDRTVQLGVNYQRKNVGASIGYTRKVKPNQLHRYSLSVHEYFDDKYYINIGANVIHETQQNIRENIFMASFGQLFYKKVFKNLDINCGYDIGAGFSSLHDNRLVKHTTIPNNLSTKVFDFQRYKGLAISVTPYVGGIIHLSKRLFLSGEFSMHSQKLSVFFGHRTTADFNLYFFNTQFRIGYKF